MAPEQKRTSSDEEIDKILAELGLAGAPASSGGKAPAAEESPAPVIEEKPEPPVSAPSDEGEFQIDLDVFDELKKEDKTEKPARTRQPAARPAASSERPAQKTAAPKQKAAAARSTAAQPARKTQAARQQPQMPQHRTSHLKDDLEKMAVDSGSETGQLTKQLRAGRKLEDITGPLQIQNQKRSSHQPSERVQKAAAFAASVAAEPEQKKSVGRTIAGWFSALAIVAVILFLLFRFVIQIVGIQGSSMEPTLQSGDRLVISGLMYTPQQGDIVILSDNNVLGKQLVKRVIATAGQTVEIDADGNVLVDGVLLEEDYLKSETELGDVTYPLLVQQGQIFVMGDNRAQSLDSRDSQIGLVDVSEVKGRVLFRLYPFGNFGGVE